MKTILLIGLSAISAGLLLGQDAHEQREVGQRPPMRPSPLFTAIDVNGDGLISADELKNAPAALLKLDKNGDGQLTADEVRPNFQLRRPRDDHGNRSETAPHSDDIVQTLMSFDRNGDGKLSKDEVPERMQGLFDRGDTNHDGFLTRDEIEKLAVQQQPTSGQAREGEASRPDFARFDPLFNALDTNHDGAISRTEIASATASLLKIDKNSDGQLTLDEVRGPRPGGDRAREDHEF